MREHKQNWLDIFSCFRVALDVRKIVLGTLGVYISILLIYLVLLTCSSGSEAQLTFQEALRHPADGIRGLCVWMKTISLRHPLAQCQIGGRLAAFGGAAGILFLAIWAFFGGAIARLAAIDFAKGERIEIGQAGAFTCKKFGSFFWAPVAPLVFVAILFLCNYLLGLAGRLPGVGPIIVGLLFFLAAISGFLVVILLIGTILGFPFMWPAIAMEGTDAFDAISRSFNYLFARPWKTLWCWLVALAYGSVTTAFAGWFVISVARVAYAGVAAGMGSDFDPIAEFLRSGVPPDGTQWPLLIAMVLVRVLIILAGGLFLGYIVSFKLTAFTIIYAIIRRDVDGTDMSEAYLPEQAEAPTETPEPPVAQQPAQTGDGIAEL